MRAGRPGKFGRGALAIVLFAALLAPGIIVPRAAVARDAWLPTSQPITSRGVHVAASLPDGRVLIAGGRSSVLKDQATLASAEIYDPLADRWLPAAPMNVPRESATATALPDGRVLVVGGVPRFPDPANVTAELYDPATNRWTLTAPMTDGRCQHAAALLPDGRVLVVGGRRGIQAYSELASAEIYDPALDHWQSAGTLSVARDSLAAAILPAGRVLAVGGHDDRSGIYSTAEIYEPTTNSWRRVARMAVARWRPTATALPDGQVLVIDGDQPERFDPTTERWIPADGGTPIAASQHTATLLPDGRVVVAGGYVSLTAGPSGSEVSATIYDSRANTWRSLPALNTHHDRATATLLPDGQMLIAGVIFNSTAYFAERLTFDLPEQRCFPETGHCIQGHFLTYWEARGSLALNGYPLTDEHVEVLEDGKPYTVQYFERTRLEYHPANQPPFDVLLGQFGRRIHPAEPPTERQEGGTYFTESGHNLGGRFYDFWRSNGQLAQFGYPITEEFAETLEDGQSYTVQYFERARFEYHPENAGTPYEVLLGQFGRRILAER